MSAMVNPALDALLAHLEKELVFGQVLLRRAERGFELRHVEDRGAALADLRTLEVAALRSWAMNTAEGAFRPLKSAPNLRRGWVVLAGTPHALEEALRHLYPGGVADWHAAQRPDPPVTHYRPFTARQTGMYRLTQKLSDTQAERVTRSVCGPAFCLKRRLWTVGRMDPDAAAVKSQIPCLEPCAMLLEFARQAMRWEQEDRMPIMVSTGDLDCLRTTLARCLELPRDPAAREADFGDDLNPRRLQWMREQLEAWRKQVEELLGQREREQGGAAGKDQN